MLKTVKLGPRTGRRPDPPPPVGRPVAWAETGVAERSSAFASFVAGSAFWQGMNGLGMVESARTVDGKRAVEARY